MAIFRINQELNFDLFAIAAVCRVPCCGRKTNHSAYFSFDPFTIHQWKYYEKIDT